MARNISTLSSTTWSNLVSEYPQGVLEYLEYLSIQVLSLSLDTKLKLI